MTILEHARIILAVFSYVGDRYLYVDMDMDELPAPSTLSSRLNLPHGQDILDAVLHDRLVERSQSYWNITRQYSEQDTRERNERHIALQKLAEKLAEEGFVPSGFEHWFEDQT